MHLPLLLNSANYAIRWAGSHHHDGAIVMQAELIQHGLLGQLPEQHLDRDEVVRAARLVGHRCSVAVLKCVRQIAGRHILHMQRSHVSITHTYALAKLGGHWLMGSCVNM